MTLVLLGVVLAVMLELMPESVEMPYVATNSINGITLSERL